MEALDGLQAPVGEVLFQGKAGTAPLARSARIEVDHDGNSRALRLHWIVRARRYRRAVFGFVYWLHTTAGLTEQERLSSPLRVPVSGLLPGSAVLFNGIRVGEVTDLALNPDNPQEVDATIAVEKGTPVAPTASRNGIPGPDRLADDRAERRHAAAPLVTGTAGEPPVLVADSDAAQTMTQAAREALQRLADPRRERRAAQEDDREPRVVLRGSGAEFRQGRQYRRRARAHDRAGGTTAVSYDLVARMLSRRSRSSRASNWRCPRPPPMPHTIPTDSDPVRYRRGSWLCRLAVERFPAGPLSGEHHPGI